MAAAERDMPGAVTGLIYKIAPADLWRAAVEQGSFAGSPADLRDGFIHFSTAAQVAATAARHFAGQSDLVLVAVATEGLDLRWEPSRGGDLFPHLYTALPVSAAVWTRPLPVGANGSHQVPDLDGCAGGAP